VEASWYEKGSFEREGTQCKGRAYGLEETTCTMDIRAVWGSEKNNVEPGLKVEQRIAYGDLFLRDKKRKGQKEGKLPRPDTWKMEFN